MSSESMSLESGTKLASYEILGLIGAGGMGEVYRAKDTKLGRDVAIKVLPEAFARDEERLARFEREARILAALNHPGIATLYGLEESAGTSYLVMELVEGETLRERFDRGPIPADEAMALFQQIAEALDAAHEKNIVHRDLKPANAKITPEEQIKVLDFGLAKDYEPGGKDIGLSDSPTLAKEDTRDGTILGTPAYMSPEQARGKSVDKRADIWAFGCCLFEALSGKSPFARDTLSDTLSAVLRDEPEWDALPKTLPTHIEPLLRHCLVKDPKHRLRDIGDALAALKGSLPGVRAEPARQPTWVPVALGVGLLAIAYALYTGFVPSTTTKAPVSRLVITLPPEQKLVGRYSDAIVFSPDGRRLVYAAEANGESRLYLREIDAFEAQPIANTEGATGPFFSPDGEAVGFFVDDEIRQAKLAGGVATLICTTPLTAIEPYGVWASNGEIIFSGNRFDGLFHVNASGGEPEPLSAIRAEQGERGHLRPYLLPNGDVLFSVVTSDGFRAAVLSRPTGEHRLLTGVGLTGPDTRHVGTSHLIYGQSGTLFAVPFESGSLDGSGSPVPVTPDVRTSLTSGFAHFALGAGNLAYLGGAEQARVVYVDRDGQATPLFDQTADYRYMNLSPDGRSLAMTIRGNLGWDVWVYELDRGTRSRLTAEGVAYFPMWHPDGERITVTSNDGTMFVKAADGSGEPERVDLDRRPYGPSWAPDGQTLVFNAVDSTTGNYDIKTWRDGVVTPVVAGPLNKSSPRFSPDGRWLAYVSGESGRDEVYVQAFPGPGEKYTLSTEGGREVVWSRDGREIFYRDGDRMMVVPIQSEPTFRPGAPRMLFEAPFASNPGGYPNYDVSLDGTRFIMIEMDATGLNEIHVVLNWAEELKRLAPPDGPGRCF